MQISRRCKSCMKVLWAGEKDTCPYCGSDLRQVGVWTDEAIRNSLAPGQVYLVYSGDERLPYTFAKIITKDGGSMKVKLFRNSYAERPQHMCEKMMGGFGMAPISVDQLLAWGPPDFPILVAHEAVSDEELGQDWYYPPVGSHVDEAAATVTVEGPMDRADAQRIWSDMGRALLEDVRDILVEKDQKELGFGTIGVSPVEQVDLEFRVTDLEAFVAAVRRRYATFGFEWRATVRTYGDLGDFVVHPGRPAERPFRGVKARRKKGRQK